MIFLKRLNIMVKQDLTIKMLVFPYLEMAKMELNLVGGLTLVAQYTSKTKKILYKTQKLTMSISEMFGIPFETFGYTGLMPAVIIQRFWSVGNGAGVDKRLKGDV